VRSDLVHGDTTGGAVKIILKNGARSGACRVIAVLEAQTWETTRRPGCVVCANEYEAALTCAFKSTSTLVSGPRA
jgi:hypothetical protein